ncbi:MAG: hypothetical protein F4087_07980 [Gemmatimonadetes bacterium]|nr:hypothetical protein [Gemmatimonadota bacterium]MYE70136.1 hypothetical protein [Gemmatimonadota bacterium]MYJ68427.1 hypothetical protein [Gemmatimonadota bacterium]
MHRTCLLTTTFLAPLVTACGPADSGSSDAAPAGTPATAVTPALPEGAEAFSLLGEPLYPAPRPDEVAARQADDIATARANYDADPDDADAIIWLGRRIGYTGRYRDAIEVFSEGIRKHPGDARMYRHRGHRRISVREFDRAIADLTHAAGLVEGQPDEIEPDGQPNERGIPTSTLQSNIHYHLALAHYLKGDFETALQSYEDYLAVTTNPDQLVAISHWWYMALRRLGRDEEAAAVLEPVTAELDVIENTSYHRLLLMYKGEIEADELWDPESEDPAGVAIAYGVANWHLYNGRAEQAEEMFRRILEGSGWAGFGYIAAEAEIARLGR